ncbi:MAG: hypothetical protein ACLRNQ_21595 [Flavonifractor plautii]
MKFTICHDTSKKTLAIPGPSSSSPDWRTRSGWPSMQDMVAWCSPGRRALQGSGWRPSGRSTI